VGYVNVLSKLQNAICLIGTHLFDGIVGLLQSYVLEVNKLPNVGYQKHTWCGDFTFPSRCEYLVHKLYCTLCFGKTT
jgi:hypothetical protein